VVLEYVTSSCSTSLEIATQAQNDSEPYNQSADKDYVREMQKRLIVEPIAEQLLIQL